MRRFTLLLVLALIMPATVRSGGGPAYCADCTLGLFNEPQMITNFGDIVPFQPKTLYLGFRVAPPVTSLAAIELSISGIRQAEDNILLLNFLGVTDPPPNIILGNVQAPADISSGSSGTGGAIAAWPSCIIGTQPLFEVQILALGPIPNGHQLLVLHRFPPSNPQFGLEHPAIVLCDPPNFTAMLVTGGSYILNPVIGVEGETWSGIKKLYR